MNENKRFNIGQQEVLNIQREGNNKRSRERESVRGRLSLQGAKIASR